MDILIINDPEEVNTLFNNNKLKYIINDFKKELEHQNRAIFSFHRKILEEKLMKLIYLDNLILLGEFNKPFINIFSDILHGQTYLKNKKNKKWNNLLVKIDKKFPQVDKLYFSSKISKNNALQIIFSLFLQILLLIPK